MQINQIFWPNFQGVNNIELGLDSVLAFAGQVGNPERYLKNVIHVAGTNGKGSTIAFLEAMLRSLGFSVNVYTSPHLVDFNERIKLNGKYISDQNLELILRRCQQIERQSGLSATFFEGTTIAAFLAFMQFPADFNLIETGLGGRLDATNIFPNKLLSVITPIDIDHQEFLGDDILGIAGEKAAIMNNSEGVVISKQQASVREFLVEYADKHNKTLIDANEITEGLEVDDLPLVGDHQIDNFKTAFTALTSLVGIDKAKRAFVDYKNYFWWPARLQEIRLKTVLSQLKPDSKVLLDGGHNIAAAKNVAKYLHKIQRNYKKIYLICNQTNDRDIKAFIDEFKGVDLEFYSFYFEHQKPFYKSEELKVIFGNEFKGEFQNFNDVWKLDEGNSLFLVAGSLFLAGEFLR
jgi:dihydrofolate synthase/folylpolyglutamate synthase